MKKIVFLIFTFAFSLSQDNICYNDCATCDSPNICLSCSGNYQIVNSYQTACVCQNNYYATDLQPIVCRPIVEGQIENACEVEIELHVSNFEISVTSFYISQENPAIDSTQSFVIFQVKIETEHSQFNSQNCRQYLNTYIQYSPSNLNGSDEDANYTLLLPLYFTDKPYVTPLIGGQSGDKNIQIPLIDIYQLAHLQDMSDSGSQIVQQMWFRILIGSQNSVYRTHRWITYIFTNRNQVQFFNINVDPKKTNGCLPGMNCIIIPGLDITGNQYQSDWKTIEKDQSYILGDYVRLRIWFKDSSYHNTLSLNKLFYLNDKGQIFEYSYLVDQSQTKWDTTDNSLHIMFQLIEPSINAKLQVEMFIQTNTGNRRSLATNNQVLQQQFSLQVINKNNKPNNSQNSQYASAVNLISTFSFHSLLALILNLY